MSRTTMKHSRAGGVPLLGALAEAGLGLTIQALETVGAVVRALPAPARSRQCPRDSHHAKNPLDGSSYVLTGTMP